MLWPVIPTSCLSNGISSCFISAISSLHIAYYLRQRFFKAIRVIWRKRSHLFRLELWDIGLSGHLGERIQVDEVSAMLMHVEKHFRALLSCALALWWTGVDKRGDNMNHVAAPTERQRQLKGGGDGWPRSHHPSRTPPQPHIKMGADFRPHPSAAGWSFSLGSS